MKKGAMVLGMLSLLCLAKKSSGQIDWEHLNVKDIIGKVVRVEKGFSPKFYLGRTPVDQISKVAEILGLKKNEEVNRLFNTFRTGRTIYKVAAYTGGAIVMYGLVRKLENSVKNKDGNAALYSGISAVGSGLDALGFPAHQRELVLGTMQMTSKAGFVPASICIDSANSFVLLVDIGRKKRVVHKETFRRKPMLLTFGILIGSNTRT